MPVKTTFFQVLHDIQSTVYQDLADDNDYINEYLEFLHSWDDWDSLETRIKYRGLSQYILCMNLWIVVRELRYQYQHLIEFECINLYLLAFLREHKIPTNQQFDYQYILGYLHGFADRYGMNIFKVFEKGGSQ